MLKEVWHITKKYHLAKGVIDCNRLKELVDRQGYRIIELYPNKNKESIQALLQALHIEEYARHKKSFVYADENNKFLFIRKGLSEDEIDILYWHELGHIWLKHNYTNYSEIIQEFDANRFVSYIKAYIKIIHAIKYILAIAIIPLLFLILSQSYKTNTPVIPAETMSVSMSPIPTDCISPVETVYITTSGEKYHKPDCRYVKNKTNVKEISKSEAIRLEYEPCKICNP